jgi:acyl-coenzyme A thioesterase PaaI-like protein
MTLLDVTLATAARSVAPELGVVTIEMKTSFMRPAKVPRATLVGQGPLMHRTRAWPSSKARCSTPKGSQLCAHHRHLQVRAAGAPAEPLPTDRFDVQAFSGWAPGKR